MPTDQPFVSIIMPIRNEEDFIARSLNAVLHQNYPHELMEILISDGMSDDATRAIVYKLAEDGDIPVTIIDNPQSIVPTGFNIALAHAQGDVIVRVDGHCEIASDYVSNCVECLQSSDVAGVGGPINTVSDTELGETISLAMSSVFGVGGSDFRTVKSHEKFVDTIAFPAYKRSAMEDAGLLDEELVRNQDDEYNYRLRSLGYKLLLTPKIRSQYYSRTSIQKLWRQYLQYGFYKVRVMQKHPRQMRPRQFAPAILVSLLLGGLIISPLHRLLKRLWLTSLAVYGTANVVASTLIARQAGWRHLPLLPFVFVTLHFSYGLGFINGLVKFRNRWR